MAQYKYEKIGALWAHKDSFSGNIEIEGKTYDISIIRNKFKTKDRHPEFIISQRIDEEGGKGPSVEDEPEEEQPSNGTIDYNYTGY